MNCGALSSCRATCLSLFYPRLLLARRFPGQVLCRHDSWCLVTNKAPPSKPTHLLIELAVKRHSVRLSIPAGWNHHVTGSNGEMRCVFQIANKLPISLSIKVVEFVTLVDACMPLAHHPHDQRLALIIVESSLQQRQCLSLETHPAPITCM